MNDKKELLDVIDEMLEKIENSNEAPSDFKKELDEKLNIVASEKGFGDYNTMINTQTNQRNGEILSFIKEAIDSVDYEDKRILYNEGHKEALQKYLQLARNNEIKQVLADCKSEERKILSITTLTDERLKGYKDGLYLFGVIVEDAYNQGKQ